MEKKETLIPNFSEIKGKYKTEKEALAEYFKMAKEAIIELKEKSKTK